MFEDNGRLSTGRITKDTNNDLNKEIMNKYTNHNENKQHKNNPLKDISN